MDPSVKIPTPPLGRIILSRIQNVYTGDETWGDIKDADIVIKDNVIEWVGPHSLLPPELLESASLERGVRDCSHIVIATAGFINTHHHFYQHLTRGVAPDSELFGWLNSLYDIWSHITPKMFRAACKVAAAELILSGCTLGTDHAYVYYNGSRLDDEISAVCSTGLRFQPVRGCMSLGRSKGGLPPDQCVEVESEALADMKRLVETYHDPSPYSMLRIALGPCSPFSVTKKLMISTARLARKYDKVLLHTHLAENENDIKYSLHKFGERPNDYISSVEWDRSDCWFAHCVQLDKEDVSVFASNGCGVAHCPSSNARLASGIAPIKWFLESGVPVGLGTDGSASNDASHLLGEARLAVLLSRVRSGTIATEKECWLSPREALYLATVGGAKCLNREDEVGVIAPGYAADIVGWGSSLGYVGCGNDPLAGLFLTAPSRVTMSVINGNFVVWDEKFVHLDLDCIVKEAEEASRSLLELAKKDNVARQHKEEEKKLS